MCLTLEPELYLLTTTIIEQPTTATLTVSNLLLETQTQHQYDGFTCMTFTTQANVH